ncbi:MAG: 3-dehydroquinate synthase [Bacteroidota bacterium]|nr:3-dehydroquinate synthase [Bacteroidota bacterium]
MRTINIKAGSGESNIYLGEKLENLRSYLPDGKKVVILTDANILKHYAAQLQGFPVVEIGLGEKNKTMKTLEHIFEEFIRLEVDRSTFIVAVGGGIVCDVTGYAASSFMRGLKFGFVSTTLLSQVDASVGGKNGVNFQGYKNMVGVFAQPEFVICDVSMFKTLDRKEFISGFAEIIKAAAIRDKELFAYLETNAEKALNLDEEVLEKLIYESVRIKATVVQNDEKEKGERRILNFGHTFAHSIEKNLGILHGEAVSIGMVLASKASVKLGMLSQTEADRIEKVLVDYKLPVKLLLDKNKVYDAVLKDKKRDGDYINLIVLSGLGNGVVQKVHIKDMEEIVNDLC